MADFYEGKLVTHRRRPEWGIGLVDGASYTKRFLDEQDREMLLTSSSHRLEKQLLAFLFAISLWCLQLIHNLVRHASENSA